MRVNWPVVLFSLIFYSCQLPNFASMASIMVHSFALELIG